MELEPGWLLRQLDAASKEVASWPLAMQARSRREMDAFMAEDTMSDEEYRMRRADSQKYGNY